MMKLLESLSISLAALGGAYLTGGEKALPIGIGLAAVFFYKTYIKDLIEAKRNKDEQVSEEGGSPTTRS